MTTKKRDFIKVIPKLEEKIYEHNGVRVGVRIDYVQKQLSLIEFEQKNSRGTIKKWIFANRGVEYEQGWQRIFTAMGYAISEAKKELQDYIEVEEKEAIEFAAAVLEEGNNK
jgi:hypothetical protein